MKMRFSLMIILCLSVLIAGLTQAEVMVTGGREVGVVGDGKNYGESAISCDGGDPSITLSIISESSLNGIGSLYDRKVGRQNISTSFAGYNLSLGYDGDVGSELVMESEGSAAVRSSVSVTAAGISTGNESYDIFGSADIYTSGYLSGEGLGESSAEGTAYYNVLKIGTPSEVWGEVSGESQLRLEGSSSDALANTGSIQNGLHADSRVRRILSGEIESTSYSQIVAHSSVINEARANVSVSGTAQGGAWDPSSVGDKRRLESENAASSVIGDISGCAESNGGNDFASVSSILQASAFRNSDLYARGGLSGHAASSQSSSSSGTYAETQVQKASWGSVARTNYSAMAIEWGNLDYLRSEASVKEADADAATFGRVEMATGYSKNATVGNMSLLTYAEAANGTKAQASTMIGPDGDGTISSSDPTSDPTMLNVAGFEGGLNHFSSIDAAQPYAETHNILGRAYVHSNGSEVLDQSYLVNTSSEPNIAWSSTYGSYYDDGSGEGDGLSDVTGGWDIVADGKATAYGGSMLFSGGSPSASLGISSTSSLDGPGTISDAKSGSQNINMTLRGYNFSLGYEGDVSSSLTLESEGSAAVTSFVGATAGLFSIGGSDYELFGSADVSTGGSLMGEGLGESSAEGSAYYQAIKIGTPVEVWGQVSGKSQIRLEGGSPEALANSGGVTNGLHTDSKVSSLNGEVGAESYSAIISYASVVNDGRADVTSSGTAQGGAWDQTFDGAKQRLANENVASSVEGELQGYAEASGKDDAASISSILQSSAIKESELDLYVAGGPASYAASSQSSQSEGTYAETSVSNVTWGSVTRTKGEPMIIEWGRLSDLTSKANVYEVGGNSLTFGRILMSTNYYGDDDGRRISKGNMSLATYAETSKNKSAVVSTSIGLIGDGAMSSQDGAMFNNATFIGGYDGFDLDHYSNITIDHNAGVYNARTSNVLQRGSVNAKNPGHTLVFRIEDIGQWHAINTVLDPNVAWAKTEGYYYVECDYSPP